MESDDLCNEVGQIAITCQKKIFRDEEGIYANIKRQSTNVIESLRLVVAQVIVNRDDLYEVEYISRRTTKNKNESERPSRISQQIP